jgi:hypothetical protein
LSLSGKKYLASETLRAGDLSLGYPRHCLEFVVKVISRISLEKLQGIHCDHNTKQSDTAMVGET